MDFFRWKKKIEQKKIIWKIKRDCLNLIFECAKSSFPHEFGGLLRIDEKAKDTITEIIILPGTISGESHAIFQMHMRPIDFSIVGTVHSHPSPFARPSDADLHLFRKYGKIHIVVAIPFSGKAWKAYDYLGEKIEVKIV
jgi:proteasome lid subunit RPN8/RPN11